MGDRQFVARARRESSQTWLMRPHAVEVRLYQGLGWRRTAATQRTSSWRVAEEECSDLITVGIPTALRPCFVIL